MRPEIRTRIEEPRKRYEATPGKPKKPPAQPEPTPVRRSTADDLIQQSGTQTYHQDLRVVGDAIRANDKVSCK